jgi:uncharacterized protein (DUF1919 family)
MDKEEFKKYIFEKQKIELIANHSGMRQKVEFELKKIKMGQKNLFVLYTQKPINASELIRLADEFDFPFEGTAGRFFPKNKKASDFLV